MRNLRYLFVIALSFLFALVSAQGSEADQTILQALSEDENFTTLVGLIEQAGLAEQLGGTGPFTVFAPSNSVFEGLNQTELEQITSDPALLEQILLSHVVEGEYNVNGLQDAEEGSIMTLQGEPLSIETTAGGLTVNGVGLTSGNVENQYANGEVQGVDYLIVPASLAAQYGPESPLAQAEESTEAAAEETSDTAAAGEAETTEEAGATEEAEAADETEAAEETDEAGTEAAEATNTTEASDETESTEQADTSGETDMTEAEGDTLVATLQNDERFSTLVSLLEQAGLVEALQGEGPFTVFAPTNEAFEALPAEQLEAVQADPALLERVLTYHVVEGNVMSSDVTDGAVMTLEGGELNASTDDGVMFNDATVTEPDIEVANGTVHVIDRVLLPEDLRQ